MTTKFKLPDDACLAIMCHLPSNSHVLDMHSSFFDKAKSFVHMLASLRMQFPKLTMPDLVGFCIAMRNLLKGREVPVFIRSMEDEEVLEEVRIKFSESRKEVEGKNIPELSTPSLLEKCLKHRLLLLCQENIPVFCETLDANQKNNLLKNIVRGINKEGFELDETHVEMFVRAVSNSLNTMRLPTFAYYDIRNYGMLNALCNVVRPPKKVPVRDSLKTDSETPKKRRGRKRKIPEDVPVDEESGRNVNESVVITEEDKEAEKTMNESAENLVPEDDIADIVGMEVQMVTPPVVLKNPLSPEQKITVLRVLKSFPNLLLTRTCGWTYSIWKEFLPAVHKLDDTIPEKNLRVFIQHLRCRNIRPGFIPKLPIEGRDVFLELLAEVGRTRGKSDSLIGRFILKHIRRYPRLLDADLGDAVRDVSLITFSHEVTQYAEKQMTVADIHNLVHEWKRDYYENGVFPLFATSAKVYLQLFVRNVLKDVHQLPYEEGFQDAVGYAASVKREPSDEGAPVNFTHQNSLHMLLNNYVTEEEKKVMEENVVEDEGVYKVPFSVKREILSPVREVLSSDPNDVFEDVGEELDLERMEEEDEEVASEGSNTSLSDIFGLNRYSEGDDYNSADDDIINSPRSIASVHNAYSDGDEYNSAEEALLSPVRRDIASGDYVYDEGEDYNSAEDSPLSPVRKIITTGNEAYGDGYTSAEEAHYSPARKIIAGNTTYNDGYTSAEDAPLSPVKKITTSPNKIYSDGEGYASAEDDVFNPFKKIAAAKTPIHEPEPEPDHNASSWRVEEL